jgi:transposase-like protein
MWSNRKSLKVVVPQKLNFKPPYCPNSECSWHEPCPEASFQKHGTIKIRRYPYVTPRFRCKNCRKVFSSSFFSLHYRDREEDTYEEIFDLRVRGFSKRQIASFLGISLDTVQRRIGNIARHGLLIMAKDLEKIQIRESIAYDGVQNFSFSQYDPNNVNHAVGKDSLFVYDFNFCHLNRGGTMRPGQKRKKEKLEAMFGRYPPRAIQKSTKDLLERLLKMAHPNLVLHSDDHYQYRDAIKQIEERERIVHEITSSRKHRNYQNPLFAINHLDLLTRHHLASFKRETIAFAKTSQGMVEDFILLVLYKNYMRAKFVKPHKRDPACNFTSPAMHVGLRKKVLRFHELFGIRITKLQVNLSEDWQRFFERHDPNSRRPIRRYEGI